MRNLPIGLSGAVFVLALALPGPSDAAPPSDHDFLVRALARELAEVKFADLVLEKSNNAGVRKLARAIRDEHGRLRESLVKLAKAGKTEAPAEIDRVERESLARLSKLQGAEFDRDCLRHMADARIQSAVLYEKCATGARDPSLRKIADRALKSIKEQQPEIRRLQKALAS